MFRKPRLAPGGRAYKPGLLFRFWGWQMMRMHRKMMREQAIRQAAQRAWRDAWLHPDVTMRVTVQDKFSPAIRKMMQEAGMMLPDGEIKPEAFERVTGRKFYHRPGHWL